MPVFARRIGIFLLGMTPFFYLLSLVVRLQAGQWDILGPEPGRAVVFFSGTWALNFLLITLAVTPLVRHAKWRWLMIHRRMLGLFAFFYASLHLLAYAALLLEWQWVEIGAEIIKRPYLLLGMVGWLLLLPLAITSTRGFQRRLGRRWKLLHKVVYLIALLAAAHYVLQIRSSWFEPMLYLVLVVGLLLVRWQPSKGVLAPFALSQKKLKESH